MKLAFATGNKKKVDELENILKSTNIKIIQKDIELEEPRSESIEEIAIAKAMCAIKKLKMPLIVEDSGLFIESLNGFPGTYSRLIYNKIHDTGILKLMNGIENRKATFKTIIVYITPKENPIFFSGEKQGTIAHECKGTEGFGYDPIFIPLGETQTWSQNPNLKANSSHRKEAIEKFTKWIKETL